MKVAVRSAVIGSDPSQIYGASIPKYYVADKHNTPPSDYKLTLGQPALL